MEIEICQDDLMSYSKEELISYINQLRAHNVQLRNIIVRNSESSGEKKPKTQKREKQKHFDFSVQQKRHVLLKFAYLGWDSQGYAVQEDTNNTIEAEVINSLLKTKLIESRETANYHRCGRTDKGVSAFSQVISVTVRSKVKQEEDKEIDYVSMLNRVLPSHIRMLAWCPVSSQFSARFDCQSRTYKYFFPKGALNIEKMEEAAQYLVGEHDYRNLCKMDVGNGVVNYVRRIISFIIQELDHSSGEPSTANGYAMYAAVIHGQAFLWHQIRAIMCVLFLVGEGKELPTIFRELLDINKVPRKPQYSLACDYPLNLYETEYHGIRWIQSSEELLKVIMHFQKLWTYNAIKESMLKNMIEDLCKELEKDNSNASFNLSSQHEILLYHEHCKVYRPLLIRPTCESLEDRVDHYAKHRCIRPSKAIQKPDKEVVK